MSLTIGEITNEVELTGAAAPAGQAAIGSAPAAQPEWTRVAAHRALSEAAARDEHRTTVEDRDV